MKFISSLRGNNKSSYKLILLGFVLLFILLFIINGTKEYVNTYKEVTSFIKDNNIGDDLLVLVPTSDLDLQNTKDFHSNEILILGKYKSFNDEVLKIKSPIGNTLDVFALRNYTLNLETNNTMLLYLKLDSEGSIVNQVFKDLGEANFEQSMTIISYVCNIPKSNIPLINFDIGGSVE